MLEDSPPLGMRKPYCGPALSQKPGVLPVPTMAADCSGSALLQLQHLHHVKQALQPCAWKRGRATSRLRAATRQACPWFTRLLHHLGGLHLAPLPSWMAVAML